MTVEIIFWHSESYSFMFHIYIYIYTHTNNATGNLNLLTRNIMFFIFAAPEKGFWPDINVHCASGEPHGLSCFLNDPWFLLYGFIRARGHISKVSICVEVVQMIMLSISTEKSNNFHDEDF